MSQSSDPKFEHINNFAEIDRRQFLILGGAGAAALSLPTLAHAAKNKIKTQAKIVIAGAGAAGLSTANRLAQSLDGAKITLIDPRKEHFYQPGFTLVAAGVKPASYVQTLTKDYVPYGVDLVEEAIREIDPEGKKVVTESGKKFDYDYLVVALGLRLDYDAIEGMDVKRIGQNGLGSIYLSPQGAEITWRAMSQFADKGGIGVFSRPATEMKCAGAPLKYTFLTEDHLTRRGNRSKAEIHYFSNNDNFFSVPIVSEKVRMLFREREVKTHMKHVMSAIDLGKRIVTFKNENGESVEQGYDFINVIPPMRAPAPVKNSPLPWQEGKWAADGWMEVDKGTLRHVRYPNVFGVGDIAGVPKGKTAASVKWQVPIAVEHLLADIQGKTSEERYNGYTSCPLLTRLGRGMLVEFDYENNLLPSFPNIIAPLEELWITWVIKTMGLKPTYMSMLRGQA